MMNEPVSTIMTKDLITLSPTDKLSKAYDLLVKHRIHHLPVVDDENYLVGLITTYDMFRLNHALDDYKNITVMEVMTTRLATLEPHDKVGSAAEVFMEHLFHALPIIKHGQLKGIVTTHDVMKYSYQKEYPVDKVEEEGMV